MDKRNAEQAVLQLETLGFETYDEVLLGMYAKPNGTKTAGRKAKGTMPILPLESITKAEKEGRSIYFCVNRKYSNDDITRCQVLFYEHDDIPKDESLTIWQKHGLPTPTIQVDTGGKSVHTYYVLSKPCSPKDWKTIQQGFIYHLKSDKALVNPGRVMRLAGSIHPETGEVAKIVTSSGLKYDIDVFLRLMTIPGSKPKKSAQPLDDIEEARLALKGITDFSYVDEEFFWHRIGMICKSISESLFDDWVQWSIASPKSADCDFRARWDSWKGTGLKRATLFKYAYECGWRSTNPNYQPNKDGNFDHLDDTEVVDNPFNHAVNDLIAHYGNRIRYNTLTNRHEYDGVKKTIGQITGLIKTSTNINLPRWDAPIIIDHVASRNSYNPIVEYLKSCKVKADVSHTNIATKYWNGTQQENEYFSLFLRAAILRQTNETNITEFPFALILIGDSGCGKSATFENLFTSHRHTMTGFAPDTNNALTKSWLCYWDEMVPVLNPANRDKVNGFITNTFCNYNVMYVSKDEQKPIPFVIGGTTTDYQFLSDTYSQRRWMVCKIPYGTRVDIPQLKKDIDAIWASAYQSTLIEPSLGSFTKLIEANTRENKQYLSQSAYHEVVATAIKLYQESTSYDFVHIGTLIEHMWIGKQSLPPATLPFEIKSILTALGYQSQKYKRVPFRDQRVWVLKSTMEEV